MALDSFTPRPLGSSASCPGALTAFRRHAFDDGEQHVDCGSAVVVSREPCAAEPAATDAEDFGFSRAQTEQFLAGGPLTLGWVTKSPSRSGGESVYVYCWVTIGD